VEAQKRLPSSCPSVCSDLHAALQPVHLAGLACWLSGCPFGLRGILGSLCGTQFQLSARSVHFAVRVSSMDDLAHVYIRRNSTAESPGRRSITQRRPASADLDDWPVACIGLVPAAFSTSIGAQVSSHWPCVIVAACCSRRSAACFGDPDAGGISCPSVPGRARSRDASPVSDLRNRAHARPERCLLESSSNARAVGR